jgi:hypothetical protein
MNYNYRNYAAIFGRCNMLSATIRNNDNRKAGRQLKKYHNT